jgi:hypothetical protein
VGDAVGPFIPSGPKKVGSAGLLCLRRYFAPLAHELALSHIPRLITPSQPYIGRQRFIACGGSHQISTQRRKQDELFESIDQASFVGELQGWLAAESDFGARTRLLVTLTNCGCVLGPDIVDTFKQRARTAPAAYITTRWCGFWGA